MQQLFNFKNDLRIENQQKLKNFFEKINLQNFIDQIMSFEKNEALSKLHKKNKHNVRNANNKKENDIEKNRTKRFRKKRENDDRERDRNYKNRDYNNRDERKERNNSRDDRERKNNNFNYEFVNKKKA